jgi:WD40 repeat protein
MNRKHYVKEFLYTDLLIPKELAVLVTEYLPYELTGECEKTIFNVPVSREGNGIFELSSFIVHYTFSGEFSMFGSGHSYYCHPRAISYIHPMSNGTSFAIASEGFVDIIDIITNSVIRAFNNIGTCLKVYELVCCDNSKIVTISKDKILIWNNDGTYFSIKTTFVYTKVLQEKNLLYINHSLKARVILFDGTRCPRIKLDEKPLDIEDVGHEQFAVSQMGMQSVFVFNYMSGDKIFKFSPRFFNMLTTLNVSCMLKLNSNELAVTTVDTTEETPDGELRVWSLETGKVKYTIDNESIVDCILELGDRTIVAGSRNGNVTYYKKGVETCRWEFTYPIDSLDLLNDESVLVRVSDHSVKIMSPDGGIKYEITDPVESIIELKSGKIAVLMYDGHINIWK